MARPKSNRRGKPVSLYLTKNRLDKLGPDPATAIYALIDAQPPKPGPPPPAEPPKPAHKPSTNRTLCPRCARIGSPACLSCLTKAELHR